jgi:hypothetical protein
MGFPVAGDLVPVFSGASNLGVNRSSNSSNAFDLANIRPFGHVHLNSGVWHHASATGWESGVIRFNSNLSCFEVSVNGGTTFGCLATTANVVTSVGVLGDTDLTGDIDVASPPSGFIVIEDSSNASPLLWSVDTLGLSGLWGFPTGGFDRIPTCFNQTFSSVTSVTVTHNLNTQNVIVQVYDSSDDSQILPDTIVATDANTVTVTFNDVLVSGRVVVMACENSG